jgi:hypothetical protein
VIDNVGGKQRRKFRSGHDQQARDDDWLQSSLICLAIDELLLAKASLDVITLRSQRMSTTSLVFFVPTLSIAG